MYRSKSWLHLTQRAVFAFICLCFLLLCYAEKVETQNRPQPQTDVENETTKAETNDVTTIRWFMRWDETRVEHIARALIRAFEFRHPNIRIHLENIEQGSEYYHTLKEELTGEQGPDVFYPATHIAYELAQQSYMYPLEDFIDKDKVDLQQYNPDVLALYQNDEQTYCLPVDTAALVLFYNRDRFDAANVPYPRAPWSWDDFLGAAQALTWDSNADNKLDHFGIDSPYNYWPLFVWSATGHGIFDDSRQPTRLLLEDTPSIDALQWLADLRNVYQVVPTDEQLKKEDDPFLAGLTAMKIGGHWLVPHYLDTADFDFDFAALPVDKFAVNRSDGSCFAIAHNAPHPAAAWEFVRFLAAPKGLGATLMVALQQMTPALRDLQKSALFLQPRVLPDTNKEAFLAGQKHLFPLYEPFPPLQDPWRLLWKDELRHLWSGEISAAEAVVRLRQATKKLLPEIDIGHDGTEQERNDEDGNDQQSNDKADGNQNGDSVRLPTTLPSYYYVAPDGSDDDPGRSPIEPLATLQQALILAQPGDTIHLAAGDYYENVITLHHGREEAPITVMGTPDAILRGRGDDSAAFRVLHNYYTLVGFTIDGLFGDPNAADGYTEKLLYAQGSTIRQGVTGLHVLNMSFKNAGGECLRLRYFATENEIAYSTFHTCGLLDYRFDDGGKNGEAIYIGTSVDQWADGKNPTAHPDGSHHNWVHHNFINTRGNECVDIKEGAHHNTVEYNTCTGQLDPKSAGLDARGDRNIFRYNTVFGNEGAGVRLGGHKVGGRRYGKHNQVYANQLYTNEAGGVNIAVGPQSKICSNVLALNVGPETIGDSGDDYTPSAPCPEMAKVDATEVDADAVAEKASAP